MGTFISDYWWMFALLILIGPGLRWTRSRKKEKNDPSNKDH